MKWYKYGTSDDGRILVLCKPNESTVISGFADSIPEYLAWLAEGNEPEEWTNAD